MLARELEEEFAGNSESRASGMVIDTMGWIKGVGYAVTLASFVERTWFISLLTEDFSDLLTCFQFAAPCPCYKEV